MFSGLVHRAKHLVVSAIEFVPVECFRTATIGRICFCNHDCGTVFLARIAYRRRIGDRENRFASLKKRLGAILIRRRREPIPADCATSLMLRAGFSRPDGWNLISESMASIWSGSSVSLCPRLRSAVRRSPSSFRQRTWRHDLRALARFRPAAQTASARNDPALAIRLTENRRLQAVVGPNNPGRYCSNRKISHHLASSLR